jgi:hypothetical protein
MGRGADKKPGTAVPVTAVSRYTCNSEERVGWDTRWAVSQRGNVDDRDLGISAFKSYSYHPLVLSHVESYRKDSGGVFKVGCNAVDIKHELTTSFLRLPHINTYLIQYGEAR